MGKIVRIKQNNICYTPKVNSNPSDTANSDATISYTEDALQKSLDCLSIKNFGYAKKVLI